MTTLTTAALPQDNGRYQSIKHKPPHSQQQRLPLKPVASSHGKQQDASMTSTTNSGQVLPTCAATQQKPPADPKPAGSKDSQATPADTAPNAIPSPGQHLTPSMSQVNGAPSKLFQASSVSSSAMPGSTNLSAAPAPAQTPSQAGPVPAHPPSGVPVLHAVPAPQLHSLQSLEETLLDKACLDGIEQAKDQLSSLMQQRAKLDSTILTEVSTLALEAAKQRQLREATASMCKQLKEQQLHSDALERELQGLKDKCREQEVQLASKDAALKKLEEQAEEAAREAAAQAEKATTKLQQEEEQGRSRIEALERELERVHTEASSTSAALSRAAGDADYFRREVDRILALYDSLRSYVHALERQQQMQPGGISLPQQQIQQGQHHGAMHTPEQQLQQQQQQQQQQHLFGAPHLGSTNSTHLPLGHPPEGPPASDLPRPTLAIGQGPGLGPGQGQAASMYPPPGMGQAPNLATKGSPPGFMSAMFSGPGHAQAQGAVTRVGDPGTAADPRGAIHPPPGMGNALGAGPGPVHGPSLMNHGGNPGGNPGLVGLWGQPTNPHQQQLPQYQGSRAESGGAAAPVRPMLPPHELVELLLSLLPEDGSASDLSSPRDQSRLAQALLPYSWDHHYRQHLGGVTDFMMGRPEAFLVRPNGMCQRRRPPLLSMGAGNGLEPPLHDGGPGMGLRLQAPGPLPPTDMHAPGPGRVPQQMLLPPHQPQPDPHVLSSADHVVVPDAMPRAAMPWEGQSNPHGMGLPLSALGGQGGGGASHLGRDARAPGSPLPSSGLQQAPASRSRPSSMEQSFKHAAAEAGLMNSDALPQQQLQQPQHHNQPPTGMGMGMAPGTPETMPSEAQTLNPAPQEEAGGQTETRHRQQQQQQQQPRQQQQAGGGRGGRRVSGSGSGIGAAGRQQGQAQPEPQQHHDQQQQQGAPASRGRGRRIGGRGSGAM